MNDKSPASFGDGQAPPPYSLTPPSHGSSSSPSQFVPSSLTRHLRDHVSAVPGRIRRNEQARNEQQLQSDTWTLDRLVPIVESFLADLSDQHKAPLLATLTLVPKGAIPVDAVLSGMEDMLRRNEISRVCRVDMQTGEKADHDGVSPGASSMSAKMNDRSLGPSREFTDWGRREEADSLKDTPAESSWWKDEAAARRLASYLQPQSRPKPRPTLPSAVQTAVEQRIPAERPRRGWGLGKWRSVSGTGVASSTNPAVGVERGSIAGSSRDDDGPNPAVVVSKDAGFAEMSAAAEEVAFRLENDFGIWESMSGWAIVVTVKIRSR